jgi:glycine betaine/proline transport system substrate-binding protein
MIGFTLSVSVTTVQSQDTVEVNFGYVAWSGEIASTNVMKLVLEQAGYTVNLQLVQPAALYQGLADGEIDVTVSAWLPQTQANYWEGDGYKDQIDWLGVNLEDAKIGLVVPSYMANGSWTETVTKLSDLLDTNVADALDSDGDNKAEITGIDPGAGMMVTLTDFVDTETGWDAYEVLDSSDATMTVALAEAIDNGDPIVVTLWSPHWAFNKFDLTYLEDDVNLYGDADTVVTLGRQELNKTMPNLYNNV